ncbi:glycosyltransferase [Lactococcus lactis]|nr:glycosyltransferase [Lactococcus lactis]
METVYRRVLNYYSDKRKINVNFASFTSVKVSKWLNLPIDSDEFLVRKAENLKNNKLLRVQKIVSIFNYFRKIKSDSVIIPIPTVLSLINLARKFNSKKFEIIYWPHFDINSTEFSSLANFERVEKYSDRILSISDSITQAYVEKGISKSKITTIYNPIPKQKKTILPNKNTTKFISIGRIEFENNTQKNNKEMFDAFAKIKSENWELDIYGSGLANNEKLSKDYVKKMGISEKVKFHGWKKYPFDEIEKANALVLTSNFEGLPMAPLEALSYGVPIVVSDINGPKDYLSLENGFKYQLHNVELLSEILLKIIKKEVVFDSRIIKESINKFYEDEYFKNLNKILQK